MCEGGLESDNGSQNKSWVKNRVPRCNSDAQYAKSYVFLESRQLATTATFVASVLNLVATLKSAFPYGDARSFRHKHGS